MDGHLLHTTLDVKVRSFQQLSTETDVTIKPALTSRRAEKNITNPAVSIEIVVKH